MIPKIIHLCWLSGDEYPTDIQKCLDTWKRILPDYEVWLWDTNRFDINSTIWTKQAFENRKYAFAADYIRLYALFNYGGIYLDSDVIMYKSFGSLLHLPYFIGQEYAGSLEPAIIGAQKGCKWICDALKHYDGRAFVKTDGTLDTVSLPHVLFHILTKDYKFVQLHKIIDYTEEEGIIQVFDKDFFNSRNSVEVHQTKKSFCAHNYAASWLKQSSRMKLIRILPKFMVRSFFFISHNTYRKGKINRFTPKFIKVIS